MKPYSLDLRRRVLGAWQRGEGSQRQLASRFSVHLTFVRNLLRLYRSGPTGLRVSPAQLWPQRLGAGRLELGGTARQLARGGDHRWRTIPAVPPAGAGAGLVARGGGGGR